MSYVQNYELVLQIHELKNIMVIMQGLAAIRVQLVDYSTIPFNYGWPLLIQNPSYQNEESKVAPFLDGNAWHTSTIRLEDIDTNIKLQQIVRFNLRINRIAQIQQQKIYLRFTLLFKSLYQSQGTRLNITEHGKETINIRIKDIETGMFHYFQDYFKWKYLLKFSFTCFCMNTNVQFLPLSPQKNSSNIASLKELMSLYDNYQMNNQDGLKYFYKRFCRQLRLGSQILKMRVFLNYRNKVQVEYIIPKYMKSVVKLTPNSYKEYFQFFQDYDISKLTYYQYEQQMRDLQKQNLKFVNQVVLGLKYRQFDIKKLYNQYKKYDLQTKNLKIVQNVQYGCIEQIEYKNRTQVMQAIKKERKNKKQPNLFPLQSQNPNHGIFVTYNICHPTDLLGKSIFKLKNNLSYKYDQTKMLVIICHGYLSSGSDMYMIKRGIRQALPLANIFVSRCNQIHTEGCITQMGKRLADQIIQYFKKKRFQPQQIILNFIGHSMGGIIARASLQHLKTSVRNYGFFCSIGTPHLGYLKKGMTKTGIWFLRKFVKKQTSSLDQLTYKQCKDIYNSFLYQLSLTGSLTIFSKIILISSVEDGYIPWSSARVCPSRSHKLSNIEAAMIQNIIGTKTVHRVDVNFNFRTNNIETFIGKKAHVQLGTQYQIFDFLNSALPNLFNLDQI